MKKKSLVKVMVFGTFDILHPGHNNFFMQAKKLVKNSQLIVSVARDANVKRVKGARPLHTETERLAGVWGNKYVDKVVLGGLKNYLPHILKERPNIIALGYDQDKYSRNLEKDLQIAGLEVKIVRLKAFYPKIHKTSLVKSRLNRKV